MWIILFLVGQSLIGAAIFYAGKNAGRKERFSKVTFDFELPKKETSCDKTDDNLCDKEKKGVLCRIPMLELNLKGGFKEYLDNNTGVISYGSDNSYPKEVLKAVFTKKAAKKVFGKLMSDKEEGRVSWDYLRQDKEGV